MRFWIKQMKLNLLHLFEEIRNRLMEKVGLKQGFELTEVQKYSISEAMMISQTTSYGKGINFSKMPNGVCDIK